MGVWNAQIRAQFENSENNAKQIRCNPLHNVNDYILSNS